MELEKVEWDSVFFGLKIGKLILHNEDTFDPFIFKERVKEHNYDLVYVFKYDTKLSTNNVHKAELDLMDIQVTMSKKFKRESFLGMPYEFRTNLTEIELKESCKIAEQTSVVSRFYYEPKIGAKQTKLLYLKWVENAINQKFCDGIIINNKSGIINGINIIKTDYIEKIGICSIIGVSQDAKNKGIGRDLWEQAFRYWSNETDIEICKVPFSLNNLESFNFHLKMGFNKVEEIKYIYHYRNNI